MRQTRIVLMLLIITVTYATKIDTVSALELVSLATTSTTYREVIVLVEVSNCSEQPCWCQIESNVTSENPIYNVSFRNPMSTAGSVEFTHLAFYTAFWFTTRCVGTNETVTIHYKTTPGHPSAPRNFTSSLYSKGIRLSWQPPALPMGPISSYRLIGSHITPVLNISGNQLVYDIKQEPVYEHKQTFSLKACNEHPSLGHLCSQENACMIEVSFAELMTTSKPSNSIQSYAPILLIITNFCLVCFI